MLLFTAAVYARRLKAELPARVHERASSRLWWLPVHVASLTLGFLALGLGWIPLAWGWLLSPVLGLSVAALAFVAHETLHGAIVRGRRLQQLIGFVGFLPFVVSPELWVAWHNRVHHGRTNDPNVDPDAYPTVEQYHKRRSVRVVTNYLAPGRRGLGTLLSLSIGFSVQSLQVLFTAHRSGILTARQQRVALLQTGLGVLLWLGLLAWVGPTVFLFAFVLPLLIGNAIVMAHILTNHTLSPHTEINDPLVNSLSVTVPRWMQWLTLGFGFHVEHHLYPWMSTRHAPAVRELLLKHWPGRYQSMPLSRALSMLHRTSRVYQGATTLVDVEREQHWQTLMPRQIVSAPSLH
jgi:fatty acid desaturase